MIGTNPPEARTKSSARLAAFLANRHFPLIAMAIGVVLSLPTLWTGWGYSDDALQRIFLLSADLPQALTKLFLFLDPTVNHALMDSGVFPWWTFENARVFFFRPLSALSLWLDYQLWPNSAALMHLHSILWYGAVCIVTALLYRRLSRNPTSAGLSAILFAVSIAHVGCVISLAARNLLMTAFFGLLAIYYHDRWRRDKWLPSLYLALFSLVLSLLSAEMGVSTAAYLLAYALFLDRGPWHKRLGSLLPYLLVILGWWSWYQINGYGAWGSGFYYNPVREPLEYLIAIVERVPMLLLGQWVTPDPVTYAVLSTGAKFLYWLIGLIVLAGIGVLLTPLLRRDRTARFLACGMLIAVIPICAVSPPSGRHLLFTGFGAFGLMGHFIIGRLYRHEWCSPRRVWQATALAVSLIFLGLHALLYPVLGTVVRQSLDTYSIAITDLTAEPVGESQDIVVVNAPSPGLFIYLPAIWDLRDRPLPAHVRILAPAYADTSITRLDASTLLVRPESGYLQSPDAIMGNDHLFFPFYDPSYAFLYGDKLFRGDSHPMLLGQRVELAGFLAEVVALTEDGRPQEVRMQFAHQLEDEQLVWIMWDWSSYQYRPFPLPGIGETVQVAGPF